MPNGGGEPPVIHRTTRGPITNVDPQLLDDARRISGYKPSARLNQSLATVGEVAARDFVKSEYRGAAKEVQVMRRGRTTPILDLVFETGKGEFVIIEAKANESQLGRTNRRVFRGGPRGLRRGKIRKDVVQFSPVWFEQRLAELRNHSAEGRRLANRLEHAWQNGKLRPILVRAPEAGLTAERVVIQDMTTQWNAHLGVQSKLTLPSHNVKPQPITDPARLLDRPTDVERGLEAVEKPKPHSGPHVPGPRLSTAGHVGEGVVKAAGYGFKARSLSIGVKAWRVTRTVGKVLVMCFVPLKVLDVVLEIALALWDREREKEEKKRRDKQRALEAVFKQGERIQALIESNITGKPECQQKLINDWDANKRYHGFLYARLHAQLEIETFRERFRNQELEAVTTYKVIAIDARPNNVFFDFELTQVGEEERVETTEADIKKLLGKGVIYPHQLQKVVQRKSLKYTIVPPLITPFDIVLTKINNLFLDTVFFVAQFNQMGEAMLDSFTRFDYSRSWDEQFGWALEFPHPLNASTCRYCLATLHWAAKVLSRHPLEQWDLEGNLENPERGFKRRLDLLQTLLDAENTTYGKNFSFVTGRMKELVKRGEKTDEISAVLEELYAGSRAIWYDLLRIEANISSPEYRYLGPDYKKPGR